MVSNNVSDQEIPPERRFGWGNLFVSPENDPRSTAPSVGERATLVDWLHAYRQTLELKCQGLDAEQMARCSVPPSDLSLLGLVRHMADVERYWFREVLAGERVPRHYGEADDENAAFRGAVPEAACVDEAWAYLAQRNRLCDALRRQLSGPRPHGHDA